MKETMTYRELDRADFPILERLWEEGVFGICDGESEDGTDKGNLYLYERCDEWLGCDLTAAELEQLGKELIEIASRSRSGKQVWID